MLPIRSLEMGSIWSGHWVYGSSMRQILQIHYYSCLCVTHFLFFFFNHFLFCSINYISLKCHSDWKFGLLCFQKACLKRRSWLMIFVRSKVKLPPESNVIICFLTHHHYYFRNFITVAIVLCFVRHFWGFISPPTFSLEIINLFFLK